MVEAHVARLASLRLARLDDRKRMAGMTGVAGSVAEYTAFFFQGRHDFFTLEPELVATTTAFHAVAQGHRQGMRRRHCLNRCPGKRMFTPRELFQPLLMAATAGIGCYGP